MGTNTPCRNCTSRYVGCHAECKQYKEFAKNLKELKEKDRLKRNVMVMPSARVKSHSGLEKLRRKRR